MDKNLKDVQLDLELEAVEEGIERYYKEVAKAKKRKQEGQLKPNRSLILTAVPVITSYLEDQLSKPLAGGRTPRALAVIRGQDITTISYLISNTIINTLTVEPTYQNVSWAVAKSVKDYIYMKSFKEECQGLYHYALDQIKTGNSKHKRNAMNHYAEYGGVTESPKTDIGIGRYFVDIFCKVTMVKHHVTQEPEPVCTVATRRNKGVRQVAYLQTSTTVLKWLEDKHEEASTLLPKLQPMVVPPMPWTNGTDGGYLTLAYPIIKYKSTKDMNKIHKDYYLDRVYKAVNTIQDTAWQINRDVLDVLEVFIADEKRSPALPGLWLQEEPPMPCDDNSESIEAYKKEHKEEWQLFKNTRHQFFKDKVSTASKLTAVDTKLKQARKFKDFDALYYPHNADFRGRLYPLVSGINPQSDGLGKSLLHFAYGVALGTDGLKWLKIHIANCHGQDKLSLNDRVKWVEDNQVAILMIAKDPLGCRSAWEEADSPWQYLAACFEYAKYIQSGEGEEFLSTLAVSFDGTNNGTQHLAALVHDPISGAQVNLVPSDKPADVYQEVADLVERNLSTLKDTYANLWKGKVTRSLVKQPVMTVAYGSTNQGMQNQVRDAVKKLKEKGKPPFTFPHNLTQRQRKTMEWEAIVYVATAISKAIDEILVGPRKTLIWLKELCKAYNKEKRHVEWVTPVGFPVQQKYMKKKSKRINTYLESVRLTISYQEEDTKLDTADSLKGFCPNLVHSYDSSHLMSTVNRLVDQGVTDFGMVHDSFATHAGHAEKLFYTLRTTFIEQYRGNVVESIWQELQEKLGQPLPKPDHPGSLDITRVMESDYFFN